MINVGKVKRLADLINAADLATGETGLSKLTGHRGVLCLHQHVKRASIPGHDSAFELEHDERFLLLLYYNDTEPGPLSRGPVK